MALTELPWVDSIVYTIKDIFVQRIHFDSNLWTNVMLSKLTSFCFDNILPHSPHLLPVIRGDLKVFLMRRTPHSADNNFLKPNLLPKKTFLELISNRSLTSTTAKL